jgi:hypothetical protein
MTLSAAINANLAVIGKDNGPVRSDTGAHAYP